MKRSFFKFGKLIVMLTLVYSYSNSKAHAQRPIWFGKINVLANKGVFDFPTTGGTWGFTPNMLEINWLSDSFNYYHSKGTFYHARMQFTSDWLGGVTESSIAAIDFYGNPIKVTSGLFEASLHNPAWQDSLIKYVKLIIDLGGDGVILDGYFPNVIAIESVGGVFDHYTMEDFRVYLDLKFTADELKNKFDITDISNFNYGDWLRSHGLEASKQSWEHRMDGLQSQFWLFEWQFAVDFYQEFQRIAKEYALATYGKEFIVSENNAGAYYYSTSIDDFLIGEFFYYCNGRKMSGRAASIIKVGKAVANKPVAILPEINESINELSPPRNINNMIKLILADIYASGGTAVASSGLFRLKEMNYITSFQVDSKTLYDYTDFILQNPYLFENLRSAAKVALVYSAASTFNSRIAVEDWNWELVSPVGYLGMSKLLMDANIQYDAILFPDSRFPSNDINLELLSKYSCIILPNTFSLSDDQVNLLLDYVNNGGKIISSGAIGSHDENGNHAVRSILNTLTSEGTHLFGNGVFIHFNVDIGRRYADSENAQDKKRIVDEINKFVFPQTKLSSAENVSVFAYEKIGHSSKILHLVNYDFDPIADKFSHKENIVLDVVADTSTYWDVVCISPDLTEITVLPTRNEQYLRITVPDLEAYNIILLQENKYPPSIHTILPKADTLVDAGSSLQFSVSVSDSDDNPLYFSWLVNNKMVSSANKSLFHYQSNLESSGIDTIQVVVSDGAHKVSQKWLVHLQKHIFPQTSVTFKVDMGIQEKSGQFTPGKDQVVIRGSFNKWTGDKDVLKQIGETNIYEVKLYLDDSLALKEQFYKFCILPLELWENIDNRRIVPKLGENVLDIQYFNNQNSLPALKHIIFQADMKELIDKHTFKPNTDEIRVSGNFNKWASSAEYKMIPDTLAPTIYTIKVGTYYRGNIAYKLKAFPEDYFQNEGWEFGDNHNFLLGEEDVILPPIKPLLKRGTFTSLTEDDPDITVTEYNLLQNYPNPFNPITHFCIELPKQATVELVILNSLGKRLESIVQKRSISAGQHFFSWSGEKYSSGLYFCQLKTDEYCKVIKIMLLK